MTANVAASLPRLRWLPRAPRGVSDPDGRIRLIALGTVVIGVLAVVFLGLLWLSTGPYPIDTANYMEAGARLNAGQPLYAAHDLPSGYAQVALFSPPLMAVIIRPFAALPDGLGWPLWIAAMAICELSAVGLLMLRSPSATAVAVAAVSPAVVLTMIVGNVDALVLVSVVIAWLLVRDGHELSAGLLIGLVASLKLTPLILLWWALATGHRRMAVAGIGVGIVLAAVAILGSEPTIFMQFINVTLQNYSGSDGPMSVAAVGRGFGVAPSVAAWLPRIALVGGAALVIVLRRHPGAAFSVAVATMMLASPIAAYHTPALLLGALIPFVRPVSRRPAIDLGFAVGPRLRNLRGRTLSA